MKKYLPLLFSAWLVIIIASKPLPTFGHILEMPEFFFGGNEGQIRSASAESTDPGIQQVPLEIVDLVGVQLGLMVSGMPVVDQEATDMEGDEMLSATAFVPGSGGEGGRGDIVGIDLCTGHRTMIGAELSMLV